MLYELPAKLRYLHGLWGFLRETITVDQARALLEAALAGRQASFLRLAESGIYANPHSPYRRLLLHAGIELGDLKRLVEDSGLDVAMSQLYDAGVYLTYEEMFGRCSVKRGDLEFRISPADLDNPLLEAQYETRSSGSSGGAGSRAFTDLTLLAHEAAYFLLRLEAQRIPGYKVAMWGPAPPSLWGLGGCLRDARGGNMPIKWFTPVAIPTGADGLRSIFLLTYTSLVARLAGQRLPWPEFVAPNQPLTIARWLAEKKLRGTQVFISSSASGATRICLAARDSGLDISGTVFGVTGEPFTPAKASTLASVGARAYDAYGASELAIAGLGCGNPSSIDDMHLLTDKLFVQTREKKVDDFGATVPALVYTTLMTNTRKILLNAESGDYGKVEERECGCLIGAVGFTTHVMGLHGYDKLTSGGVTFIGSELYRLVEEVLPARFGGNSLDYQLAEEEDANGLPQVSIVISPRVGELNEADVVDAVLESLRDYFQRERGPMMADEWRHGRTLRVVRREPFSAGGRKVVPLHILRQRQSLAASD
jgi:hypothetical protein